MNKKEFIKQLRATADELSPLAQAADSGSFVWNGSEYAKSDRSAAPDPYALSWQTTLGAIAELLEAQESPITVEQMKYLERLLFGGMGSLNDLSLVSKASDDVAKRVNDRLDTQRRLLFAIFKKD